MEFGLAQNILDNCTEITVLGIPKYMFRFFPPKTDRNKLLPKVPILSLKEFGFVPVI
jgi:hypothetical protein